MARAERRKPGANGTNGANGSNGSNGAGGAKGETGTGEKGVQGVEGKAGTSAEAVHIGGPAHCVDGGAEVKSASPTTYVCNGSPWTAGGTLPPEKTETGTWTATIPKDTAGKLAASYSPISFTIPLANAIPAGNIKIEPTSYTGTETECPGTAEDAKAAPGYLCIYTTEDEIDVQLQTPGSTTPDGIVILTYAEEDEGHSSFGSWAVTAPEA